MFHPFDQIEFSKTVKASVAETWRAWTTIEGTKTFFALDGLIELRPGGKYEMYFDVDAPVGDRGGEGCTILAIEEYKMISFTWNAPPEIPSVRFQKTHVTIRLNSIEPGETQVTLLHDGWGTGTEWMKARKYFERAWGEVVLPRLVKRFENGPINWEEF